MRLTGRKLPKVPDWADVVVWGRGSDQLVLDVSTVVGTEVVYARRIMSRRLLRQAVSPPSVVREHVDACVNELKQYKEQAQCAVN